MEIAMATGARGAGPITHLRPVACCLPSKLQTVDMSRYTHTRAARAGNGRGSTILKSLGARGRFVVEDVVA